MKKEIANDRKRVSWGLLGTIGVLVFGKLKYAVVLLKVLKLQTLISMFIYLGTYALIFGWKFAAALVYLIFVHEMGHLYAAKRIKLPVSPAIFIPFMGAVIGMKEMPKNAKDEGYMAYMGPLFGLLSFLPAIPLYLLTHEPFWALLIILGAMINLFNLIPITPLDGGRIAAGISTKLWGLGIILLLAFSITKFSILGFIITAIGAKEWYSLYKRKKRLHADKEASQELELFLETVKRESMDLDSIQRAISDIKGKISHQEITAIVNSLDLEIEKMKKDHYLQQLSGTIDLSEEDTLHNQQVIEGFITRLEEKLLEYKKEIHTTETYYKTDTKTKLKLFSIYIGLIAVLAVSYYYGNEILMNHPEVRKVMHR